jgi:hypothetical protein
MANEGGAHNYTVIASNTPAVIGNPNNPGPINLARVIVTSTITGTVTIYDNPTTNSGPILFAATTPAIGTIFEILIRAKYGAWCVPGSAGTLTVTWDP